MNCVCSLPMRTSSTGGDQTLVMRAREIVADQPVGRLHPASVRRWLGLSPARAADFAAEL